MTTDHWLTIAQIIIMAISTLAGPVAAARFQSRISQPKPTPKAKTLKKPSRVSRIRMFLAFPGINVLAILLGILFLISSMRREGSVSRGEVFRISYYTVTSAFSFAFILFRHYGNNLEIETNRIKAHLRSSSKRTPPSSSD
jgi:hypothetical protein